MVLLLGLASCSHRDEIRIELSERNGSGISGVVELEPVDNGRSTRIRVVEVEGGRITGTRIDAGSCSDDGVNDLYAVRPPEGVIQLEFELLREALDDGSGIAAAFLTDGRYVACGER